MMPADLVVGEGLLSDLHIADFLLYPHMGDGERERNCTLISFSSEKATNSIMGVPPV